VGRSRPVSANFHAAIGLLKLGALELGPCEVAFRKALDLDPANDAALGGMFQLYGRLVQYAKLQPFLDRGLKAKPDSLGLLMLSGNSLMRQELWAEAKDRFDRALVVDPKNAAALANRGSAKHISER
jgi:tetratricopeptide (TPR) repeat protein